MESCTASECTALYVTGGNIGSTSSCAINTGFSSCA
jgi:hypothetical protein